MKILSFGSLNLDYIYHVDHIASPGESVSAISRDVFAGGKGLNQSIAMARAGARVYHAGCVGEDGASLLELCKREGIDTSRVKVLPHKTGHAVIQVSGNGQNSILIYGGANRMLTTELIDAALADFGQGDIIVLQNELNLLDYTIDAAHKKGIKIALNPSPFDDKVTCCDLKKVSVFILNEIEAQQISGSEDLDSMIKTIRGAYPGAQTVITWGERGAVYFDADEQFSAPALSVSAVDTTGAGDTFTGYFLASLANGEKPESALKRAAAAAGVSVTRKGAVPSIPYVGEISGL